jgi:hypothetical protein
MKYLRAYLADRSIDADAATLSGVMSMKFAFSKGDPRDGVDYYVPEVKSASISVNGGAEEPLSAEALEDAAELLLSSEKRPLTPQEVPVGTVVGEDETSFSVACGKEMQIYEANDELAAWFADGDDVQFQNARWKVFSLTDEFEKMPCSRETFDVLTERKDADEDRSPFRDYYSAWVASGSSQPGAPKV